MKIVKEVRKEIHSLKKTIRLKLMIILLIIILTALGVYYLGFYAKECLDEDCFYEGLVSCKKVKWINDASEAAWLYTIKGISKEKCIVDVNLLLIKKGKIDLEGIEGKEMRCYLPLYTLMSPEQNLENCHGLLKEDLQDLIIKRMHSYLLENLGKISGDVGNLTKPL